MKKLIYYPVVVVKGVDFTGCELMVVPNQSMSLREILERFVKKQSLPIGQEGQYIDQYGIDLEKLSREDIVDQLAVRDQLRDRAIRIDEILKDREKAERAPEIKLPPEPTKPPSDEKPDK